jgi:hypothetical protein
MRIPVLDLQPAIAELRPELDAAYRRVLDSGRLLLGDEFERVRTRIRRQRWRAPLCRRRQRTGGPTDGADGLERGTGR